MGSATTPLHIPRPSFILAYPKRAYLKQSRCSRGDEVGGTHKQHAASRRSFALHAANSPAEDIKFIQRLFLSSYRHSWAHGYLKLHFKKLCESWIPNVGEPPQDLHDPKYFIP